MPRVPFPCRSNPRFVGDPIDVVTGANIDAPVDLVQRGPILFQWVRYYSSARCTTGGSFGWGHAHDFDRLLRRDLDGLRYQDRLGGAVPFPYLREGDSVLAMTLRDIPIPPVMNVYSPDIPFYRMLEQGQSVHEAVGVPVPVREVHPYCERTYPDKTVPVSVTRIEFSVEYLWCRDKYFAYPTRHDPELVQARGAQHHLLEKVLELQRPVIVEKRLDEFHRY